MPGRPGGCGGGWKVVGVGISADAEENSDAEVTRFVMSNTGSNN
jgi:hypothetical protein